MPDHTAARRSAPPRSTRPPVRSTRPPARTGRPPARTGRPPVRNANRRSRRRRRGPRRSLGPFAAIAVLVAVIGLVWQHRGGGPDLVDAGSCTVPGTNLSLSTEQTANAATIAAVARARGLPARATVIALATAQQESRLRNLDHGDRDSLGLFQQRPSQGWGTEAQVQDPVYAAGQFFDRLVEVPGWETGRLTEVAQQVQRSGFPEAYQQWSAMAESLAAVLLSPEPAQLACSYAPPDDVAPLDQRLTSLTDAVRREAGAPTVSDDGTVSVGTGGWPEASWAVAHADRFGLTAVLMDGWRWTPDGGWETSPAAMALPLTLRLSP